MVRIRARHCGCHRFGPADGDGGGDGRGEAVASTAVVFALELTHDVEILMPLLPVATVAHLVSVLVLKRSILTEKVARRGFHVLRRYEVGPLKVLFVRDVMATEVLTIEGGSAIEDVYRMVLDRSAMRYQRLLPITTADGRMVGVLPWNDVLERAARGDLSGVVDEIMYRNVLVAYGDETLRSVADRMADGMLGVLPVVERGNRDRLVGMLTQFDLLRVRGRMLEEERHREQVLRLRVFPAVRPRRSGSRPSAPDPGGPPSPNARKRAESRRAVLTACGARRAWSSTR